MKNPALSVLIAYAVFSVIFAYVMYRKAFKKKVDFRDTFPQTAEIKPIGMRVVFKNGASIDILPGTKRSDPIVIESDNDVLLTPYLPEDELIVHRLKARNWMYTLPLKTYLKPKSHEGGKSANVFPDGVPLVSPPKELVVCFEAIDVNESITYQIDVSFIRSSNTP